MFFRINRVPTQRIWLPFGFQCQKLLGWLSFASPTPGTPSSSSSRSHPYASGSMAIGWTAVMLLEDIIQNPIISPSCRELWVNQWWYSFNMFQLFLVFACCFAHAAPTTLIRFGWQVVKTVAQNMEVHSSPSLAVCGAWVMYWTLNLMLGNLSYLMGCSFGKI